MIQIVHQYIKTLLKGGTLVLNLVPAATWQQQATKVCFTQVDARTTCKRPDTPSQIKLYPEHTVKGEVVPESIGYTELLGRGMTGAELVTHRNKIDARQAAEKAAYAYVQEQREKVIAITADLAAMGIEF